MHPNHCYKSNNLVVDPTILYRREVHDIYAYPCQLHPPCKTVYVHINLIIYVRVTYCTQCNQEVEHPIHRLTLSAEVKVHKTPVYITVSKFNRPLKLNEYYIYIYIYICVCVFTSRELEKMCTRFL